MCCKHVTTHMPRCEVQKFATDFVDLCEPGALSDTKARWVKLNRHQQIVLVIATKDRSERALTACSCGLGETSPHSHVDDRSIGEPERRRHRIDFELSMRQ